MNQSKKIIKFGSLRFFSGCSPADGGVQHSFIKIFRGVAQLVAYYVRDVGAAGSSPVTPTIKE
jgi:hypothetical protein